MFLLVSTSELFPDKNALRTTPVKIPGQIFLMHVFKAENHHLEKIEPLLWSNNCMQFCILHHDGV